jgi:glycosyltransferase involved in cell wall biosynthesis
MKILHITTDLSPVFGGHSRACAELCESLAAAGLDVTLLHLTSPEHEDFQPAGVTLRKFPRPNSWLGRVSGYSSPVVHELKRLIPQMDLLHLHGAWRYQNWAATRIARRAGVPYIVQPHGSMERWRIRRKPGLKPAFATFFEKMILKHARAVQAESELDRREILHYLPDKDVFVVPCGAFPDRLNAGTRYRTLAERWPALAGHRVALFLSRVDVNKGLDLLIKAFQRVKAGDRGWRLLIVGPDYSGTRARMESLAARVGLAEYLVWAGTATEEERRLALQKCDFYVLPSLSENFGISVLEALFCARPVITTTRTPWERLQQIGAGLIVQPNVRDLAEALERFLPLSPSELDDIGRRGYELARSEFDWHTVAERQREAYQRILNGERCLAAAAADS